MAVSLAAAFVICDSMYRVCMHAYRRKANAATLRTSKTKRAQPAQSTLQRLRQRASLLALLLSLAMVGGRKVKSTSLNQLLERHVHLHEMASSLR